MPFAVRLFLPPDQHNDPRHVDDVDFEAVLYRETGVRNLTVKTRMGRPGQTEAYLAAVTLIGTEDNPIPVNPRIHRQFPIGSSPLLEDSPEFAKVAEAVCSVLHSGHSGLVVSFDHDTIDLPRRVTWEQIAAGFRAIVDQAQLAVPA